MKYILLLSILMTSNVLFCQNECPECAKFRIVGVYDFGPPPGGNWIIVLLTVTEDLAPSFDPHYSSLYFVSNEGDTITIPLGPSYTLPIVVTDTIPYLMELNTGLSNQNFPTDFDGKLVIRTPNGSPCPNVTWCHLAYSLQSTKTTDPDFKSNLTILSPNPFRNNISIETEETIDQINIYNQFGTLLISKTKVKNDDLITMDNVSSGLLLFQIKYSNAKVETYRVLKIE